MTDYIRRFTPEAKRFFGILYLPGQDKHDFDALEENIGPHVRQAHDNIDTSVQVWTRMSKWETVNPSAVVFDQGFGWEVLAYEDFILVYEQLGP
jgi:hypothetical protein